MKNLSKVLFFCLLAFISMQSFGQRFGIQAGANFANMLMKDDEINYSEEMDTKMNLGFNAGVNVEFGFGDLMALEIGLLADTKGFKIEEQGVTVKVNALYADLPILFKVAPTLGPVKIFGAVGPYVGVGITGKYKMEADGESETEDIKWGDGEDDDSKRLDYGAKFGAGAEISNFYVGLYYSLGLANSAVDTEDGYKEQHRVLSISVGYKFGK